MTNDRTALRLHAEISRVCLPRGLNGDPLADVSGRLGTLDEELLIVEVLLDLPAALRRHPCAEPMVRAAVLTTSETPAEPAAPPSSGISIRRAGCRRAR